MRNIIILIILCFHTPYGFSQDKDSVSIAFKAKLFTVSEYGIADKNQIIKDIESQGVTFLKTKYDNFVFMKIDFSQPYRLPNNHTQTLYRDCSYYIAFNVSNSMFYRLGGFDKIDIDSFFEDLKASEGIIFKDFGATSNEIEDIDIHCLYNYYSMKKKKRRKKGFNCLVNCSKKTETTITTY